LKMVRNAVNSAERVLKEDRRNPMCSPWPFTIVTGRWEA